MKIKLLSFLIFGCFLLTPLFTSAEPVIIYDSFKDFQNEKGTEYKLYVDAWYTTFAKAPTIVVKHKGKKLKIKCIGKWGIKYKGQVYRVDGKELRLIYSAGNGLFYYENGFSHLDAARDNTDRVSFTIDGMPICFVSKSLTGEIYGVASNSGGNG